MTGGSKYVSIPEQWISLTNENNDANIAPFWTLTYLLFCRSGFWYQGVCTERMERVFCECKFDNDLQ